MYSHFYDRFFGAIFHSGHRVASELMNIHSITVIPKPFETLKEIRRVCKENAEVFFFNYGGSDDNIVARIEKAWSSIRSRLGLGKAIDLDGLLQNANFKKNFKDRVTFSNYAKS